MNETKFRSFLGDNPVLVLFLGACPAMAASSAVLPALGMAGAVLLTMLLSTAILSALRRLLPLGARLPAAILVTAGVVSVLSGTLFAFGLGIVILTGAELFTGNTLIRAFGGTSILIMVGVVLDTIAKVESQMKMYDYDGFFK